jgi:hypothetical protein
VADTQAPVLTSLTLPLISVTYGAASVTFGASAADPGDGVARLQLTLDHPLMSGGGAVSTISFNSWNGGASSSVALPVDSSTMWGTYQIVQAVASDLAGNSTSYTGSGLTAIGIQSSFVVQSNSPSDTIGPVLETLAETYYGGSHGSTPSLLLAASATDVGAGVANVRVFLDHAIKIGTGTTEIFDLTYLSTDNTGKSYFTAGLGPDPAPGYYQYNKVEVTDKSGNVASYDSGSLAAYADSHPGVRLGLMVPDRIAPVLSGITLPSTIDASQGNATAAFSAVATDNVGIKAVTLEFTSALNVLLGYTAVFREGLQPVRSETTTISVTAPLISYGVPVNSYSVAGASFSTATQITPFTHSGTYTLTRATVIDTGGNQVVYEGADLARLSNTTSITVTGDEAPPVLTSLTIHGGVTPDQPRVGISVTVNDPGTQLGSVTATFDRPVDVLAPAYGSTPTNTLSWTYAPQLGGDANMANFGTSTTAAYGITHLTSLTLVDRGGHSISYTGDQLQALGFDTDVKVGYSAASDFNGDQHSDLLWRNVNGDLTSWQISASGGNQFQHGVIYTNVDPSWKASELFDINGDGVSDILWRNTDSGTSVWRGNGNGTFTGIYYDHSLGNDWRIAATGDFNADGKDDILWRATDGGVSVWRSIGAGFQGVFYHSPVATDWKIVGTGDFNGDGKDDVIWRGPNKATTTWQSTGDGFAEGAFFDSSVGSDWRIEGIGDFDGDGQDDLFWHSDRGEVSLWKGDHGSFNTSVFYDASVGPDWRFAEIGDFNGDGRADILWRSDSGALSMWLAQGDGFNKTVFYDGSVGNDWNIVTHNPSA